jgi:hypothetical protein
MPLGSIAELEAAQLTGAVLLELWLVRVLVFSEQIARDGSTTVVDGRGAPGSFPKLRRIGEGVCSPGLPSVIQDGQVNA